MENPPKKYFRLHPDGEVRLKGAYFIKCVRVDKDDQGNILKSIVLMTQRAVVEKVQMAVK